MTPTHPWRKTFLLLAAMVARVHASDPTAVYARIDKVVLQPTAAMPETVQILGVFSVAKPNDRNDYLAPARGYWYFKLADNPEAARSEWADLTPLRERGRSCLSAAVMNSMPRCERPTRRRRIPIHTSSTWALRKSAGVQRMHRFAR